MNSVSEPGGAGCGKSGDGPVELVTLVTVYDPVEAEIIVSICSRMVS